VAREKIVVARYYPQWNWVVGSGAYLDDFNETLTSVENSVGSLVWSVCITAGIIAVILGVLSWLFGKAVTKPILQITKVMQEIAEGSGDLTQGFQARSRDEISLLARAFNTFRSKVHDIIAAVKGISEQLSAASAETAQGSEAIADQITAQSSDTASASAAVEEISASVGEVARGSQSAAASADLAGQAAREGGDAVRSAIEGMNRLAQVVKQSAAAINELGKRGQEIGQVINVINDIADQTNLLALNAAIEAARAGEHGRGFAVVADEVRKLADRTASATREVSESIKLIQRDTTKAVQQMDEGTHLADEGLVKANDAGSKLQAIVERADEVASQVRSIAAAAEEQTAAAAQIAQNVERVNHVSKQTAAASRQAANAVQQMSVKAEQMQTMLQRFNLNAQDRRKTQGTPPKGILDKRVDPTIAAKELLDVLHQTDAAAAAKLPAKGKSGDYRTAA
jgi:methyl-accepting chemotaxis protein